MWAFGLFDAADGSLVLSRDRLGVKPLYVHQTPARLVFASEIKAIVAYLRHCGEPVRPNEASIATYAATGLVDGLDDTFFAGVTRFPAGSTMRVTPDGAQTTRYWDLPAQAAAVRGGLNGASKDPSALVRRTLDEAVRVHLRSDVPLGVCLSGGLDSSAIVGPAPRRAASTRSRSTSRTAPSTTGASARHRDRFGAAYGAGRPTICSTAARSCGTSTSRRSLGVYPQWQVMGWRAGGRQSRARQPGQGRGLPSYMNYASHTWRAARLGATGVSVSIGGIGRLHGQQARQAGRSAVAMRLRAPVAPTSSTPDAAAAPDLWPLADVSHNEWRTWPRLRRLADQRPVLGVDADALMALLRYEGRLSMGHSIESRVPFLDHRLVELGFAG
jgi:asparagine synthase (glutamine-hydrolysing)